VGIRRACKIEKESNTVQELRHVPERGTCNLKCNFQCKLSSMMPRLIGWVTMTRALSSFSRMAREKSSAILGPHSPSMEESTDPSVRDLMIQTVRIVFNR
jgi:hypothetical protein